MPDPFPSPDTLHPVRLPDGSAASRHRVPETRDRSSAHGPSATIPMPPPSTRPTTGRHASRAYLFDFSPERLILGRFCQIANGVRFVTASANHRHDGISSFPFAAVQARFRNRPPCPIRALTRSSVMTSGSARARRSCRARGSARARSSGRGRSWRDGAALRHRRRATPRASCVTGSTPDRGAYPRRRVVDWPIDHILAHEAAICGGDVAHLERVAP
jgi:virginiamycin A acetyltransferase